MIIERTDIPSLSLLNQNMPHYDYADSFQGDFSDKLQKIDITDIGRLFFSSGPKWIEVLFSIRNKIVALFGLKTSGKIDDRQKMIENFKFEKGERLGLFKVYDTSIHEIILGEDDKHLNFRVSLYLDESSESKSIKKLVISTTVKFNNWFGRLYFLPVRPFHSLIVPAMLKGVIINVERDLDGK
jgi:hypothetical protein